MPATDKPARQPQSVSVPNHGKIAALKLCSATCSAPGVLISAAVVLWGASIYLFRHGHEHANYRVFKGEPSEFRTISGVIHSVRNGQGRGWIQLGLLLLIATPIARVASSIVGFALERDRLYVAFTLIVFVILLYSLLGSGLGM